MDPSRNSSNPATVKTQSTRGKSDSAYAPKSPLQKLCSSAVQASRAGKTGLVIGLLVLLMPASTIQAESSGNDLGPAEGIVALNRKEIPDQRKSGIGALTNTLLGADAAVHVLDAYSTLRMLHNRCNGDPSVRVCNQEMFLPDSITHSKSTMYGYEGAVWFAETLAVHKLAKHHRRLARLIPVVDIATTLPFAVNNLRLPLN
jgi:hypothetical protein